MQIPHEFHSLMNLSALKSLWKRLHPGFIWQIVVNRISWFSVFLSTSLLPTNVIILTSFPLEFENFIHNFSSLKNVLMFSIEYVFSFKIKFGQNNKKLYFFSFCIINNYLIFYFL